MGRATLRFWSGQEWTSWVWDGTAVVADRTPVRRPLSRSDVDHLEFISMVFLPEALAMGVVMPSEDHGLGALVRQLTAEAEGVVTPPGAGATPIATSIPVPPVAVPTPQTAPTPRPALGLELDQARQVQRSRHSALGRWWARSLQAVGSDLAVHGLAYLGALLFFVGVFGLVVFAFGDIASGLRPLAELVIAVAPFAAGAMLLRRQAFIVGRTLEVMGGLLLPIIVVTTFLDGVAFPPDLEGIPLVLVLSGLTAFIGAFYARWARRHASSALRFMVAPTVWLAVAMATLGLGRTVPVGKDVATPSAAQVAAIAAALVVTLAWARSRPRAGLAGPTLSAAGPGLLVVALLALLTWTAEGWPTASVLISGVLVLTGLELLRDKLSVNVLGLAGPLWWALVWAAIERGLGTAPAGVAAAIGFVVLVEVAAAARRPVWAVALPAMGAAAALVSTWSDARWATAAFSAAAVWALGRRMAPFALTGAAVILDWVAAVLPAFALAALAEASSPPTAVAAGTGMVLLATLPAVWPLLRRDSDDAFWTLWWRTAGVVVALAAAVVWTDNLSTSQKWLVTISLAVLAMASTVGPIPSVWRPWPVTALSTAAWLTACATVDVSDLVRAGTLAVAGLVMVAVAHTERWGSGRHSAASLGPASVGLADLGPVGLGLGLASVGLAGHVVGVVAVLVATNGQWSLAVAAGLATTGWSLTAVMDGRDVSPVGQALRGAGTWVAWLPVVLAAVGLPATVALGLDAAGVLRLGSRWAVAVPAVTAVAYAAATRLRLPDRIGVTAAWAGFAAGILASALAVERLPEALGLGAIVVSVAALRPKRRAPVMTWAAWTALAPWAGLLAAEEWPWFGALPWQTAVAATLVAVGGVLLVGGASFDLYGRPWAPRYAPVHPSALAPVVIGGGELLTAMAAAHALLSRDEAGWVTAGAAGAILATALLARTGALSGVATVLGWVAVVLLAGPQMDARPWIPVAVALALLVVAQVLSMVKTRPDWWARWDLPLMVTAAPVAMTALVSAAKGDHWGGTFVLVGFECLAVTVRLRRILAVAVPVGAIGTTLVLSGAADAGQGWLALALLGLSVTLTVLAAYAHGSARLPLQIGGALAALAAWQIATTWFGWPVRKSVDVTAVGAAMLAMAAVLVARFRRLEHSWVFVWGGMAVAVEALAALSTATVAGRQAEEVAPSWLVSAGLLLVAVALLAGAAPLAQAWLRGLGMAFGVASVVEVLQAGHAGSGAQVAVLAVLSAVSAVLSLSLSPSPPVRRLAETWQKPFLVLGVAFALGSIAVAVGSGSNYDVMLLVPGLAASALQAAAVGVVLRNTVVQMLSPVLACASWLVFSSEAMDDNPQWITVPMGLATLTVAELWRQDRKQHGGRVAVTEIVVLELAGVGLLVGAAFVQAVTEAVVYAVLSAALGLAVTGWGVVTKVRRRVAAGALTVLASVVVLVAVPLVGLLPSWEGAGLWVLIAAVGLVALLVASFLEQGKIAARKGLSRFGEATVGWE